MVSVGILISTCNERIEQVLEVVQAPQAGVHYVIIHQVFEPLKENTDVAIQILTRRTDVTLIQSNTQGLSMSRNLALNAAHSDLVLFCDDDVTFNEHAFEGIRQHFQTSNTDFMTFRFNKVQGGLCVPAKSYPPGGTRISRLGAFKVSSVEIAARRDSLMRARVRFDTRFGLGSPLPGAEDIIFVSDCVKSGLTGQHSDVVILTHPPISSGDTWTPDNARARGALFRRVFGYKGIIVLLPFLWRHRKRVAAQHSFLAMSALALGMFFRFKP